MTDQSVAAKLSRAKAKLVMYHPFFASIVCSIPMTEDNSIPTMATNGKRILYNADFVDGMTSDEVLFVLCHEVGHCMFNHMFRRNHRDLKRWNIAGDYVINDMLVSDKIGTMPSGGLFDPALVQRGGGTTEGVYDLLPDSDSGDGDDGYSGTSIDLCEDAPGDAAEQSQAEAEMRVSLAQAARVAKQHGKLSSSLARLVDEALEPKVNWKDVMRDFATSKAKIDLTYARPNRRFMAHDLIMPSLDGEALGEIVYCIDCSGSTWGVLGEFGAEVKAFHEDCKPVKLHIIYFDTRVSHHDQYSVDDTVIVEGHGGGGTAFSPVFDYMRDHDIAPDACVVLTDLYCDDFGPQPEYPVLWVSNGTDRAPWGDVITIK